MDKIYSYQQMVLGILNIHIQINETRHRTYNINTHMHKLNNRYTCKMKIFKSSRKKQEKCYRTLRLGWVFKYKNKSIIYKRKKWFYAFNNIKLKASALQMTL